MAGEGVETTWRCPGVDLGKMKISILKKIRIGFSGFRDQKPVRTGRAWMSLVGLLNVSGSREGLKHHRSMPEHWFMHPWARPVLQ